MTTAPTYPRSVHIIEVGPRDGLQIEPKVLTVADKLELIGALAAAGLREIEVGSFVKPDAVPQMANSAEVIAALPDLPGMTWRALWLNTRGLELTRASRRIAMEGRLTITASETFIRRNTNRGIEDAFADMPRWIEAYRAAGMVPDSLGVMAAFGCNFEGDVPVEHVIGLIARTDRLLTEHGSRLAALRLADTMGWANPLHVRRLVGAVRERWPEVEIKLHLHDTRGAALANAVAALEMGVRQFDAAIGGLGGCPFAGFGSASGGVPPAVGNVCTEDLVALCEEMGIETGLDLDKLVEAALLAERLVGHTLPGKVMKGGSLARLRRRAQSAVAAVAAQC
ncbi:MULTISPECIES: hydroxymethylglutaryl-CoA lyase [Cupriavidus]